MKLSISLVTTALVFSFFVPLAALASNGNGRGNKKTKVKTEFQASCVADIERAGCAGKDDGGGLMKCLHAHKKAHKEFELSPECKSATVSLRSYKELKEKKTKKLEN